MRLANLKLEKALWPYLGAIVMDSKESNSRTLRQENLNSYFGQAWVASRSRGPSFKNRKRSWLRCGGGDRQSFSRLIDRFLSLSSLWTSAETISSPDMLTRVSARSDQLSFKESGAEGLGKKSRKNSVGWGKYGESFLKGWLMREEMKWEGY